MRKILIMILCCALLLFATGCADKNIPGLQSEYEVSVGEVWSLPVGDAVYTCSDDNVEIANGKFIARKRGSYTVTVKLDDTAQNITVNAVKNLAPKIAVADFTYAEPGKVMFPAYECRDCEGELLTCSVTVQKDGQAIATDEEGFEATEPGEYTAVYTAEDDAGNRASQESVIFVRENATNEAVFAPLESVWGSQQFYGNFGFKNSYSTEIKWGNEAGSTKLSYTVDRDPWIGLIFLRNVLIADTTGYSRIVFHIYSTAEWNLNFSPNWVSSKGYIIYPDQWNTVELSVDMLKNSSINDHINDYWYLDAANALALIFADYTNLMGKFDVYFGNIYLVK